MQTQRCSTKDNTERPRNTTNKAVQQSGDNIDVRVNPIVLSNRGSEVFIAPSAASTGATDPQLHPTGFGVFSLHHEGEPEGPKQPGNVSPRCGPSPINRAALSYTGRSSTLIKVLLLMSSR